MLPSTARTFLILFCALLLGACGFGLRGSNSATAMPETWKRMHLDTTNPNSEFNREIKTRFAANGIEWVDRDEAAYLLQVSPERFTQRNLSLNSEARAAEFELTLQARFAVLASGGQTGIPETEATVVKQMENDPRNVVGKAEEIRIIKSEMRIELAQQILRRIGFYAAANTTL